MDKIATPQDIQAELRAVLAYCEAARPSRAVVASKLSALSDRLGAGLRDLERPAQNVLNLCKSLYLLTAQLEASAKLMKSQHPDLAADVLPRIAELDRQARRLSMDVEEGLLGS